ncbi:MAG: hypothetical protein WBL63_00835 [Candidatus Acidiferrum sp.]
MSSLPHQISVRMDPDERLVAAVGGAARYLADAAGLGNEMIVQFQASVVSACNHCFHCHPSGTPCGITLRRSSDRLELEVDLPGTEPQANEMPSWAGIDEVHRETRDHAAVLRLTKFVSPNPPAD